MKRLSFLTVILFFLNCYNVPIYYHPIIEDLPLKKVPAMNGEDLITLSTGDLVKFIERSKEKKSWYKVELFYGLTGWCKGDLLVDIKNENILQKIDESFLIGNWRDISRSKDNRIIFKDGDGFNGNLPLRSETEFKPNHDYLGFNFGKREHGYYHVFSFEGTWLLSSNNEIIFNHKFPVEGKSSEKILYYYNSYLLLESTVEDGNMYILMKKILAK